MSAPFVEFRRVSKVYREGDSERAEQREAGGNEAGEIQAIVDRASRKRDDGAYRARRPMRSPTSPPASFGSIS